MSRYSDDEDVSWKVRRAAAKVLFGLIGTRNELLVEFYRTVAPTLLDRSSDREESVRTEVLAALEVLLKQTIAVRTAEVALGGRNKRKRSQQIEDENDTPDNRYACRVMPLMLTKRCDTVLSFLFGQCRPCSSVLS